MRGRYPGHRLAQGRGHHLLAVDGHAQDDGLDVLLAHDVARDGDDGLGLITRRSRHRCRLAQGCGEGGSGWPCAKRAAGESESHRDRFPTRQSSAQAMIVIMIAHDVLLRLGTRRGRGGPQQVTATLSLLIRIYRASYRLSRI